MGNVEEGVGHAFTAETQKIGYSKALAVAGVPRFVTSDHANVQVVMQNNGKEKRTHVRTCFVLRHQPQP